MQISQMIKANLGVEVAFAEVGGWDTHVNQGGSQGQLANRFTELSAASPRSIRISATAWMMSWS